MSDTQQPDPKPPDGEHWRETVLWLLLPQISPAVYPVRISIRGADGKAFRATYPAPPSKK